MKALARALVITAIGLALSGCATLRASQQPTPELTPRILVEREQALFAYHQPTDAYREGMSRRAYRDHIVDSYLGAIQSRYTAFTDTLENGERESGFLNDLLLVALTGATSLVDAANADELATITAMAAGGRATIDHRLFFDRTLPAVVAAMNAERATILAEIQRKRNLPIEQYSLGEAFDDIDRLQQAGRLSRGITRVTQIAEADRQRQQTRLDAIAATCDNISTEAADLNAEFRQLVGTDAVRLRAAAEELGMELAADATPSWAAIRDAFDLRLCDDSAKRTFIANLRARVTAPTAPAPKEAENGGE